MTSPLAYRALEKSPNPGVKLRPVQILAHEFSLGPIRAAHIQGSREEHARREMRQGRRAKTEVLAESVASHRFQEKGRTLPLIVPCVPYKHQDACHRD